MGSLERFRFCIDRGGTFTDVYAEVPSSCANTEPRVLKLLSEDPQNYDNAPREGIRRVLEEATGVPHPRDAPIDASRIEWIRMGTTVATNGLLEREGARFALVITKGFGDALEIGNQARPRIFDIRVRKSPMLYDCVVEADERCRVLQRGGCAGGGDEALALGLCYSAARGARITAGGRDFVMGASGEWVEVLRALDEAALRASLLAVRAKGVDAVAIVFAHAYAFGGHEDRAAAIARDLGFTQVSASAQLLPTVRLVPRGQTACVDAYLTPFIRKYLDSFARGFVAGTLDVGDGNPVGGGAHGRAAKVSFMQSDGGLTPASKFAGFRAVLSGPAGGVVGFARTTARIIAADGRPDAPVIGFDMGGTSTDVSRFAGAYEHVLETETAGVKIACPQLDINTVAAGGGSRLFFREGVFVVGPESAKAHPGPICYRKQGHLAVTDANLYLGRLVPAHFPRVFGPNEDEPLDAAAAAAAIEAMTGEINTWRRARAAEAVAKGGPLVAAADLSPEDVALGFIRVANEAMCRPIRELSEARGFDPSLHVLACFGGAGAQHVCAIARSLGIRTAVVHAYAGILSAYGMGLADVVVERQVPCSLELCAAAGAEEEAAFEAALAAAQAPLTAAALAELASQGFAAADCRVELFAHLRYAGTDSTLVVAAPVAGTTHAAAARAAFRREYGFDLGGGRALLVDDARARGVGGASTLQRRRVSAAADPLRPPSSEWRRSFFATVGWVEAPVYVFEALGAGHVVRGPALVINGTSTCVVEPRDVARVTAEGDVVIVVAAPAGAAAGAAGDFSAVDPVQLSVFSNRFMSIAEQMGRTLQRTATSVNIKERLDFSCAIFGGDGALVANAPHVPVHLGAMADTVRCQVAHLGSQIQPGDVIVANAPFSGGSHLPDITVITPVFDAVDEADPHKKPILRFYCASRGHHADVGGSTPGSMPADSTTLSEEGAVIDAFFLVKGGTFDEAGIVSLLEAPKHAKPPADKPHSKLAACRNLTDVVSDLRAQVAANAKGIDLLRELMHEYGSARVLAYMRHVQDNAARCVRRMIIDAADRLGGDAPNGDAARPDVVLRAVDYMDDGAPVALALTLRRDGTAHLDFAGTGPQTYGNWNAPPAITTAAVIYCLRLLVGNDMPLNSGCLEPVTISVPDGCLLAPSPDAAVCAGNVLTSQRVTDVILKAFGACAASQGCMNNLTFGDENFGYYETIAGGSGAGPDWDGTSGVQCHMTNTRMTDVEVIEKRYPVLVERFSLRRGSGGEGAFRGGDGVVRELSFLRDGIVASLLTERRSFAPYGLAGGAPGARGINTLLRGGKRIGLGAKLKVALRAGDTIRIETPGGGGYGAAADRRPAPQASGPPMPHHTASLDLGANAVDF